MLQLRRARNRRPQQRLHEPPFSGNSVPSANSILPAVFAFLVRTFHAHCNAHSPDGGFSGGTTVTSRTVFPLRCQPISRPLSRIPFLSNQRWHVDRAGKRDRILALCRQERYPNRRGAKQNWDSERPAKTAGRSSRFRPKASAPRLHQRNGLDFDLAQAGGV